jgi:glycosyltransferase involved in cell wall biosynthesis
MVTVLLPVYNGEHYLCEAVDSILAQTFRDWELLIVDDASRDGSRRIAADYAQRDPRITVLANSQGKGLVGALNSGLAAARGVYVARMDADDISLPVRLEKQVAYLEAHPAVTLCGTWVRLIGEHAGMEWKLATDWDTIRCTMLFYGALAHPTVMWRRADFERNQWRYDAAYSTEDYELWTRIAGQAGMANLPEILYLYRTHPDSYTRHNLRAAGDNARIHLRQFQRMDLAPTPEELDLHERISHLEGHIAPDEARQAMVWLDKLVAGNHRSGFLPETAFEHFITRKKQDIRAALPWGAACSPASAMPAGHEQAAEQPPRVTVLMPVYNAAAHLPAAIESILAQSFTGFELLIIDDHSTDNSLQIAESYGQLDRRIRVVTNPQNTGVGSIRNQGLDLAAGDYLAYMDADDISLPGRLAAQVAYLDTHPEVSVCGTWVRLIGGYAGTEWRLATDWDTIRCTMLFYGAFANPTAMLRRNDFLIHNWRCAGRVAEDYDLWTRIAATAQIVNLPQVLLLYRVHEGSLTQDQKPLILEQNRCIHLRLLRSLGLEPTAEELDLHESLGNWRLQPTLAYARRALAWLDQLLVANRNTRFLPEVAFARLIAQKRCDIRAAMSWRTACTFGIETVLCKAKELAVRHLPQAVADWLAFHASRCWQRTTLVTSRIKLTCEALRTLAGLGCRLQKTLPPKFKIGMAVLAHERPDYLELCLDSLFKTNLHDYDITFLISDDGSQDPRVRELINRPRDPRYKIVRAFTPKGPNNAGAAINKAVRRLLELDNFDIIGWCDPDALFHPDWLDQTMRICLWAKQHHKLQVLGPFSSFNSSDYVYHRVLGTYRSPYGNFVVKRQMGMVNYFYFKEDFLKLGFFAENPDEETLMTKYFARLGVRNFCTETSYVEHLGQESVLNRWRPTPVRRLPHGMQLAPTGWGYDMERLSPYAFYRYLKKNATFGASTTPSKWPMDVLIPVIRKDLATLPLAVAGLRKNLRHPLGKIILVSPPDAPIQAFCRHHGCEWRDENSVLPIRKTDIHYEVLGLDRSGWVFKQMLQLYADHISSAKHILLLDADTVLLQPQKFEHEGRSLMLVSDEYHWPYFVTYQKMFGYLPPARFSLIAHHLFVNRRRLAELRAELEQRHQRPWYQVIVDSLDPHEGSAFAEYETYGHWMLHNHRDEVELEYWFNIAIPRNQVWRHAWAMRRCSQHYRAVSYHHYHV